MLSLVALFNVHMMPFRTGKTQTHKNTLSMTQLNQAEQSSQGSRAGSRIVNDLERSPAQEAPLLLAIS